MTSIAKSLPPLELLQELLEISLESPSGLVWKNPRAYQLKPGQAAGTKTKKGYWRIGIRTKTYKQYMAHRIVYFLQTGKNPGAAQVDHIFGVHAPLNLRLATGSENQANSKKRNNIVNKQCSSKFKGVHWHKKTQKWRAQIQNQHKKMHLGVFANETEAAVAYNKAATEYFGEFAKLNTFEELV
jgi:hypothetical protein